MKILTPLFALFILVSCKTQDIVKYTYKSTTMLGSKTMTIRQDSVVTVFTGRGEGSYTARPTTEAEWKELQEAGAKLDLDRINTYEAPTNERQTDASPFGTLFITTEDSTYNTQSFDGYDAPGPLLPLVGVIKKISNADYPGRP